jgi:hypothetical protein
MFVRPILCAALVALAACSSSEELAEQAGAAQPTEGDGAVTAEDTSTPATPGPSATSATSATAEPAAPVATGPRDLSEETELYLFKQSWPEAVGKLPALTAQIDREGKQVRRRLAAQAAKDRKATEGAGFPFNKHSYGEEWKVVAEIPGWLSLSKEIFSFTGGAHGIYGVESLVWDKKADSGVRGIDMFASPEVLGAALGQKLCDALDAERLRRRGPDYIPDSEGLFSLCPDLDQATVLVGSSNRQAFDRITIYFGPYVAGPYAEGAYELGFRVDTKVLDAVKPEYRPAFTIRR